MNKKIANLFNEKGLTVNRNTASGSYMGYDVNVGVSSGRIMTLIVCHIENASELSTKLNALKLKFTQISFNSFGILMFTNGITINGAYKNVNQNLDIILPILKENGIKGSTYCPVCGDILSDNKVTVNVDGFNVSIDEECRNVVNQKIEESERAFQEMPNNYAKGAVGALVGAVVGGLITYVLFFIGLVSAWAAVAGAFLGCFLYKKLGGKPNGVMVAINLVLNVIIQPLVVFIVYLRAANATCIANNYTERGIAALNLCFKKVDGFKIEMFSNIALVILFAVIGIAISSFYLIKGIKRSKKI